MARFPARLRPALYFAASRGFHRTRALGGGGGGRGHVARSQCWLRGRIGASREEEAAPGSRSRGKAPPSAQLPWSPEQMATLSPGVRAATFNTFKRLRSACRGSLADIQNRLKTRDGARRSGEL